MRTRLRGKVTLLFMMLGILLAVPTVALAADLLTEAELSSQVSTPTIVAPNATTNFDIKVWARGSIPNLDGLSPFGASIGNAYTMGAGGAITINSRTIVTFQKNHDYGRDGQFCPATVPAQSAGVTGKGCATDPFIVPATLTVGNLAAGTNGTLSVSANGANSMVLHDTSPEFCSTSSTANDPSSDPDATDCTGDQGFVRVNTASVANNDTNYNTNEDTPLNEPAPGVLGNDTDADNTPLTAVLVSGPSHAAATNGFTLNSDGSFAYTPEANFHGTDTFTYNANDGTADSNVATVTITVASDNDAPTCENVAIETDQDTEGSVAPNCSDADGDPLTYAIEDQPADGAASVDSSTLKYNPDPNFNGSDSFTYSASDGSASSGPVEVDVTVNPVIYNWNGFFSPVDNPPANNEVKAGRAIPVKFSLEGDQGLDIFESGYPKSVQMPCESTASVDAIEQTLSDNSSHLTYNATTDTYTYVWKTDKAWAGTCRQLVVKLNDGSTEHVANFQFVK